jgi:peptide/nickel transport system permease protein
LWALAWRRLRADRVAMASLAVVLAFLLMVVLSACGLIVADWEQEVAVSYAPPRPRASAPARPRRRPQAGPAAIGVAADRARTRAAGGRRARAAADMYGVVDPLADDLAALRAQAGEGGRGAAADGGRRATCRSAPTSGAMTSSGNHQGRRNLDRGGAGGGLAGGGWARCSARCPATAAAWSMISSTGSTASSRPSRPC